METAINGRRYWKVGHEWYKSLQGDDMVTVDCQSRFDMDDEDGHPLDVQWSPVSDVMVGKPVSENDPSWFDYRAPCDDPTAAPVIKEAETIQTPKTPRTTMIDYPLIPEVLSRLGPVILLPVDNAPDFGFFALILKSVAEDPQNARYSFVTLHDGMTWRVRATVDEVSEKVTDAWCKCEPLETVAKTSTITLRDQLAMASLPALIQKYSGQDRFALSVTDRLTMCREAYAVAEDMTRVRGA